MRVSRLLRTDAMQRIRQPRIGDEERGKSYQYSGGSWSLLKKSKKSFPTL